MKTFELPLLYRNKEAAVWCLGYKKIHTIWSGLKMKGSRRALFQLLIYLAWWQDQVGRQRFLKVSHNDEISILRGNDFFFLWNSKSNKKDDRSADYWSFSTSLVLETSCFFFLLSTWHGRQAWKPLRETVLISS